MRVLFIQPKFPGQYVHLMRAFAAEQRHELVFLGDASLNADAVPIPGVRLATYRPPPRATQGHDYVRNLDNHVTRGEAVREAAAELRRRGFMPDLVCAHHGWGEPLFIKAVFPAARLLVFFEYYFNTPGSDADFDPEYPATPAERRRGQIKNASNLLTLELADVGYCPTRWQLSRYPSAYRQHLHIIHDGIDTDAIAPDSTARFTLPHGRQLSRDDPVISFAVRGLEPLRGIHSFLRALPFLFAARPDAEVVIAGNDLACYGKPSPSGSYIRDLRQELGTRVPWEQVHCIGWQDHAALVRLFQITRAHIYLTYPFVLSWSILEAMAAAAPVIGSATAPVEEVIRHEANGLLVDFFDARAIAAAILRLLDDPQLGQTLGRTARTEARRRYDLQRVCLPQLRALCEQAGKQGEPSPQYDRIMRD